MRRMLPALVLGLLLAPAAVQAANQPKPGTYEFGYITGTNLPIACLIKITPKDDGVTGEMVAAIAALPGLSIKSLTLEGDVLKIALKRNTGPDLTFEGRVTKAGADTVLGTFEMGANPMMGRMTITDKTELTPANSTVRLPQPEPMQRLQELNTKVAQLRASAAKSKDKDQKAKLTKDVAEADKLAKAEEPKVYREVIEKHADSLAVDTAVTYMIRNAAKDKANPAQVRAWAAALLKIAEPYGKRYQDEVTLRLADLLSTQNGFADVALEHALRVAPTDNDATARQVRVLTIVAKAQKAAGKVADADKTTARIGKIELEKAVADEKALTATAAFAVQVRVLNALAAAQKKSGMTTEAAATTTRVAKMELDKAVADEKALTATDTADKQSTVLGALAMAQRKSGMVNEATQTEARLEKVEIELDHKYETTMPPFKPTAFDGRKGKSDRVAVMELFTGAQCPPCVAADLAFDGLMKTYKPQDVLLIQYHMHIPGPDPMTNTATEARWDYYREIFPGQIGGVPSTLFNGEPQAGGGGGIPQSEAKYNQYRGILDELLEKPAGAAVTLAASRVADMVTVRADVSKLSMPGESIKLRLLVAEESIRFKGSNGIRFHHMVVRAAPGGIAGMALTKADSQHSATLNLAELRKDLTKYLDEYAAEKRPFPQPQRPLDFKGLKAIALVQDDKTGEILQAVVVDVAGDRADH